MDCLLLRSVDRVVAPQPTSQLGALVALTALGPDVLDEQLLPVMSACAEGLDEVEEGDGYCHRLHLRGALAAACRSVIRARS